MVVVFDHSVAYVLCLSFFVKMAEVLILSSSLVHFEPRAQRNAPDQLDCSDGLNANIRIRIRRQDLQAANPGRYRGTLTMTVSPE